MLASYFNITVIAEWCTFITGILLLDKKTRVWRLFIPLFFLVLCAETNGWYINVIERKFDNSLAFNILMLITTLFTILFFTTAESMKNATKSLQIISIFFLIFWLINIFFFQKWNVYNSYSDTFGDVLLTIISCYFFYTVLRDKEYRNLLQYDYFWFAIGVLFSSLGSAVLYLFSNQLYAYYLKTKINVGMDVNYAVNVIFCFSLIMAFICRRITTR